MAIPHRDVIKMDILTLLYKYDRLKCADVCNMLAPRHPELTQAELHEKYQHSTSKWVNEVQWARNALCAKGLLYRPAEDEDYEHGDWAITPKGRYQASQLVK